MRKRRSLNFNLGGSYGMVCFPYLEPNNLSWVFEQGTPPNCQVSKMVAHDARISSIMPEFIQYKILTNGS
jgi:hypothetical protein